MATADGDGGTYRLRSLTRLATSPVSHRKSAGRVRHGECRRAERCELQCGPDAWPYVAVPDWTGEVLEAETDALPWGELAVCVSEARR